ncbi:hypothetical protein D1007_31715 [Hordeum vulgare]|nr:hypothetical protein D1007_31715 [Hordeum vulgare]
MQNLSVNRGTGGLNGIVQGLELHAREFYGHGVADMPAKELARILLHDGCYLLRWLSIRPPESNSYKFGNTEHRDVLYLIENQMPFSVLEEINQRATVISTPLSNYLAGYVRPLLAARNYISAGKQRLSPGVAPRHLLDLVHTYFHPTLQPSTEPHQQRQLHQHTLCEKLSVLVHTIFHPTLQPSTELHQHTLRQKINVSNLVQFYNRASTKLRHLLWDRGSMSMQVPPSTELQPPDQHNMSESEVSIEMQALLQNSSPPSADSPPQEPTTGRWRLATDYRMNANLKFMCRGFAADVTCVLDVHLDLEAGTLWIPRLQVDSGTWTLLRNLMALEEQMPRRHVTAYCIFMSQVACTVEDVQLLVGANIVQHFLGSDEIAAQGYADLCNGVVLDVSNDDYNYLKPMWHQLEGLCGSRRRNFKGSFRQKYFSKALHKLAFGITVFLALCQLLQALYAPIAYHFPKKGS